MLAKLGPATVGLVVASLIVVVVASRAIGWTFFGSCRGGVLRCDAELLLGGLGMPWCASDSFDATDGHVSGWPSGG